MNYLKTFQKHKILNNNMKLSIIIPAFNASQTIEDCLDSIVTQEFDNYEVFVVDNGSNDNTLAIVTEYSKKYSKVKPLHLDNPGVSLARNHGIHHAVGKYLMFVDADDYLEKGCLAKIFDYVDNTDFDPDIVMFGMNTIRINGTQSEIASFDLGEIADTQSFIGGGCAPTP